MSRPVSALIRRARRTRRPLRLEALEPREVPADGLVLVQAFDDWNENAVWDAGEPGVADLGFEYAGLDEGNGEVTGSFNTGSDGTGTETLTTGDYAYEVTAPFGYSILVPFGLSSEFTISEGQTTTVPLPLIPIGTGTDATDADSPVVISQVYGAGGGTGSAYNRDFVELFNRGTASVDLSGWSVQYADTRSGSWQVIPLSGTLAVGRYYLVGGATGATGSALPTPDVTSTVNLASGAGKVVLAETTTALSGVTPNGSGLADLVGYGHADWYEGTGPAPGTTGTTAAIRTGHGNYDANDNLWDSVTSTVNPRTTASAAGNRIPKVTVPGIQWTAADTALTVSGITVADADAGTSPLKIDLWADHGTLTLATTTGLTFTDGDGTADGAMTFSGSLTAIGNALNGLTYTPETGYRGAGGLSVWADDQGNTGAGGALIDWGTVTVSVGGQVVAVDEEAEGTEDTAATIDVRANDVWVGEFEPSLTITANPAHGTAEVGMSGEADGMIVYTPDAEWNGTDTFTYQLADFFGHSSTATVTVNVAEVNDAAFTISALYQSEEGRAINYGFDAPDATEPLTWTADGLPDGLSMNSTTGNITGRTLYSVANGQDTSTTVTVTATASGGDTDCQVLPWNVLDVNRERWQDDVISWAGAVVALNFTAQDEIGNPLSYEVTGLPPGVTFDEFSQGVNGFTDPDHAAGEYDVTIRVTGGGATDVREFTWTVLPNDATGGFYTVNGTVSRTDDIIIVGGGGAPFLMDYHIAASPEPDPYVMTISGPATFENGQTAVGVNPTTLPNGLIGIGGGNVIMPTAASTAPNDIKIALWQGEVKKAEFDITAVKISMRSDNPPGVNAPYDDKIRKRYTPAAMKDRIAPLGVADGVGVPTWVAIHFSLEGGAGINGLAAVQDIVLQTGVRGGPLRTGGGTPDNGVAVLSGSINVTQPMTWHQGRYIYLSNLDANSNFVVRIVGDPDGTLWGLPKRATGYQTQPGQASKLNLRVWAKADGVTETSAAFNGGESYAFSVAAIPIEVKMLDPGMPAAGPQRDFQRYPWYGIQVGYTVKSDSGRLEDLGRVWVREVVKTTQDPWNYGPPNGSGYLADDVVTTIKSDKAIDKHFVHFEGMRGKAPGIMEVTQAHLFKDLRTGAEDIPVANSGFVITYTGQGSGGVDSFIAKKVGKAVNENFDGRQVAVDAGTTDPASGIVSGRLGPRQ